MARLANVFLRLWMTLSVVLPCALGGVPSYFKIKTPSPNSPWLVGQSNLVQWISADEGVTQFDIELARLKTDGLLFVARNVSTSWHSLNIMLDSVPAGDDYYVLFLDATHGNMYSISDRFSILSAGSSPSAGGSVATPNPTASTVTLKGGPNPTAQFAYTFAGVSGAIPRFGFQTPFILASAVAFGALLGGLLVC